LTCGFTGRGRKKLGGEGWFTSKDYHFGGKKSPCGTTAFVFGVISCIFPTLRERKPVRRRGGDDLNRGGKVGRNPTIKLTPRKREHRQTKNNPNTKRIEGAQAESRGALSVCPFSGEF